MNAAFTLIGVLALAAFTMGLRAFADAFEWRR